ncbi:Potassium transporter 4 [Sarracenia purpurea var. burkii]
MIMVKVRLDSLVMKCSLIRHAKFSLLPNQQAADEELSAYKYGPSRQGQSSLPLKRFLEKHKKLQTALLIVVLLGASMVIVLSSVSGLQYTAHKFSTISRDSFEDLYSKKRPPKQVSTWLETRYPHQG